MSRIASFIALVCIIIAFGAMFFKVMAGFWLPLFLAALLVVIFKPLHRWMLVQCKGREKRGAILTTLAILFIVMAPITWVGALAVMETEVLFTEGWRDVLSERAIDLRKNAGLEPKYPRELLGLKSSFDEWHATLPDDATLLRPIDRQLARPTVNKIQELIKSLGDEVQKAHEKALVSANDGDITQEELDEAEKERVDVEESLADLKKAIRDLAEDVDNEEDVAIFEYDNHLATCDNHR